MKNIFLLLVTLTSQFAFSQTCSSGQTNANGITGSTYSVSQTFIPCNNGSLSSILFYPAHSSSAQAGYTIRISDSQGRSAERAVAVGTSTINLDFSGFNYQLNASETYTINFTTPAGNAFGVKLRYSSTTSSYLDGAMSGGGAEGDLYFSATVLENELPTDINLTAQNVDENQAQGTIVGTLSTTDTDATDTHIYAISGTDAASFDINGSNLETAESFDLETKSSYGITITSTDNKGGSFSKDFTINVNNVNEPIELVNPLNNLTVEANFIETIDVSTVFSDVDGDDLTFSATSSNTDAVGVSVDNTANTIMVFDNDITNLGNVTITLTADDGNGETNSDQFDVNLFDPGNAPTDISLDNNSVLENEAIGTVVGQLTTTDLDVIDSHTYSLSGTDAASFQINGSALETAAVFDFETKNSYDITITTDDGNTNTFDKNFTILIENIQLEGLLSKYLFDNNLTDSLGINDVVAVGSPTYSDDRNGNTSSALQTSTGNFARSSSQIIDLNSDYSINTFVRLDQAIGSEGKFILSSRYDNANVPQGGLILLINSNKKLQVTYFSASGSSQTQLLSMADTEDFPVGAWQMITVTKNGSDVTLYRNGEQIVTQNYTSTFDNGVRWNIGAVDGGTGNRHWPGSIDDLSFYEKGLSQQEIDDLKDEVILSPTDLTLSNASIGSELPTNSLVGFLSSDDPEADDTFTYSISGTDAASFTIDGDRLLSNEEFDNSQKNTYDITLTTTDAQGLSFDKDFTINIESVDYLAGLRGLYTFNDGSLTNVSQEQFAAPDAVAVGSPSATSDRRSEANRALQISPENFARINSNVVGDGVFMINGWFKLDSDITSDSQIILDSRQNAQGQEEGGFTISLDADEKINVNFFIRPNSSFFQNVLSIKSEESINVGEWNMFTITRTTTNSNRRITVYLNGRVILSGDLDQAQSIPPYDPGTIFTIGAQGNSNRELDGAIDDLAFYTQWNQTKINALFTRPELNASPSDITITATAIDENNNVGDLIGMLSTTDLDETDTHTYSISGTAAASFAIDGNSLNAAESFDFETKSSYDINITADDGNGGTFMKEFVISVNDVAENTAPSDITLSNASIDEGLAVGTVIGVLATTDENEGDTHSYTVSGTDASSFTIGGQNLVAAEVFDFETQTNYSIDVTSTDQGGLSFSKTITITVLDVDENNPPVNVTISNTTIQEGLNVGTVIGALTTEDPDDKDTHTYAISGLDAASFTIDGSNLLSADVFDFETKSSYSITINATDNGGLSTASDFTIEINDVDEAINNAPTDISLDNTSVDEGSAIGTIIGELSTVDINDSDTHTYTISGTDMNSFTINGNNLETAIIFDFESKSNYSISIATTDNGGLSYTKDFTITVNDLDEAENSAPTDITLSSETITENRGTGSLIGLLLTEDTDASDTHTYSVSGPDASNFTIGIPAGSETSQLGLLSAASFDFETKPSYSIEITTNDGNGGTFTKAFTIEINDINEAPTQINLSNNTIQENQSSGGFIGYFTTVDPDANESHTITLSGSDADDFSVGVEFLEGPGNVYVLRSAKVFDFEIKSSYSVSVSSSDKGGLSISNEFTINIIDEESENSNPTGITLSASSINENEALGTIIGTFTTVDEDSDDAHIYTLSGEDSDSFAIAGDQLTSNEVFDFETKNTYTIEVTTDDGNGGTFTAVFEISIIDLDESELALNVEKRISLTTYPNPATDRVFVKTGNEENAVLQIVDLKGQIIISKVINGTSELNLTAISKGIYILEVIFDRQVVTQKLILK